MKDRFDDLQRHVQEMERFFKPYREMHEQLLKTVAPSVAATRLLTDFPAGLAGLNAYRDLLPSSQAAVGPFLADFASLEGALGSQVRSFQKTFDALSAQTRWIEEAVQLATRPKSEIVSLAASIAAVEKLDAGRSALLDAAAWANPRPFGFALTDILYAGRSSWALSYSGTPASNQREQRVARVARESEAVIAEFAKAGEEREQHIPDAEAQQEVTAVSDFLAERSAESSEATPSSSIVVPDQSLIGSIGLLVTLAEVMRIVETTAGKAIAGGYSTWALSRALDLINGERSHQDRFSGLVRFLHDFFVNGVDRAGGKLRACRPQFFSVVINDLRNTDAAHTPETANRVGRIAVNLKLREVRIREIAGKVPVTSDEWAQALINLLQRAAEAAKEFRDRLS